MTRITISYIASRIREPSTWAGLGTALTGVGVTVSPEHWQAIMGLGMGIGGMIAVLFPDGSKQ